MTLNEFQVPCYHSTDYWLKKNTYHREKEVFVNIFNLEDQNNNSDIEFLQLCFSDIWKAYVKVRNNGLDKIMKEIDNDRT